MGIWTLVYATEPDTASTPPATKVLAGTLKALRDAVVNAADVKVLYRPRSGQWRAITCSAVLAKGSGTRLQVIAEGSLALAINSPAGNGLGAESYAFDSGGFVAESRHDPVHRNNGNGAFVAAPLRWYVRDYEVPFWATLRDDLPPRLEKP